MARPVPKYGWQAAIEVERANLSKDTIHALGQMDVEESFVESFVEIISESKAWAKLESTRPTFGECAEAIRQGQSAHSKGEESFDEWLKKCDSKTRQLLVAHNARNSEILENGITFLNFEEASYTALSKWKKVRPGRPKLDAGYELATRLSALFERYNLKVTSYDPTGKDIEIVGRNGGSCFANILSLAFNECNISTSEIGPYLTHAINRNAVGGINTPDK